MKIKTFLLLLSTLLHGHIQINAQSYPASNGQWTLDSSRSDEFDNGFDTQKWGQGLWFKCQNEVFFRDENVTVLNGRAKIKLEKEDVFDAPDSTCYYNESHDYIYSGGNFISKFTVGSYSFIEIKAKTLHFESNMVSAIWMSDTLRVETNPNVEIDIMETLKTIEDSSNFSTGIHEWLRDPNYEVNTGGHQEYAYENLNEIFHHWGVERNGDSIRFYFDGQEYLKRHIIHDPVFETFPLEYRPDITKQKRRIIISLGGRGGDHSIDNFPQEFEIEYIRVYTKRRDCPVNLTLSQAITKSDDYQASNEITASSTVHPYASVNLRANTIYLKPGFSISGNTIGKFNASVAPCQPQQTAENLGSQKTFIEKSSIPKSVLQPIITPNPTETNLLVQNAENIANWSLVNLYGEVVIKAKTINQGQTKFVIETERLTSGIYFFTATMDSGFPFRSIVIKK